MAILAKGTTLTCNGTEVGELLAITPPKMSVGTIEVTHLNSASIDIGKACPKVVKHLARSTTTPASPCSPISF